MALLWQRRAVRGLVCCFLWQLVEARVADSACPVRHVVWYVRAVAPSHLAGGVVRQR